MGLFVVKIENSVFGTGKGKQTQGKHVKEKQRASKCQKKLALSPKITHFHRR